MLQSDGHATTLTQSQVWVYQLHDVLHALSIIQTLILVQLVFQPWKISVLLRP